MNSETEQVVKITFDINIMNLFFPSLLPLWTNERLYHNIQSGNMAYVELYRMRSRVCTSVEALDVSYNRPYLDDTVNICDTSFFMQHHKTGCCEEVVSSIETLCVKTNKKFETICKDLVGIKPFELVSPNEMLSCVKECDATAAMNLVTSTVTKIIKCSGNLVEESIWSPLQKIKVSSVNISQNELATREYESFMNNSMKKFKSKLLSIHEIIMKGGKGSLTQHEQKKTMGMVMALLVSTYQAVCCMGVFQCNKRICWAYLHRNMPGIHEAIKKEQMACVSHNLTESIELVVQKGLRILAPLTTEIGSLRTNEIACTMPVTCGVVAMILENNFTEVLCGLFPYDIECVKNVEYLMPRITKIVVDLFCSMKVLDQRFPKEDSSTRAFVEASLVNHYRKLAMAFYQNPHADVDIPRPVEIESVLACTSHVMTQEQNLLENAREAVCMELIDKCFCFTKPSWHLHSWKLSHSKDSVFQITLIAKAIDDVLNHIAKMIQRIIMANMSYSADEYMLIVNYVTTNFIRNQLI